MANTGQSRHNKVSIYLRPIELVIVYLLHRKSSRHAMRIHIAKMLIKRGLASFDFGKSSADVRLLT
ncbi:hypothetical protein D3C80_1711640 [compost metagenome]